jgi:uncharacterized membrane protein (DUF4010 family)
VLGLTDADALTLSMAQEVGRGGVPAGLAARAVAVGLFSNTLVKTAMSVLTGGGSFRLTTGTVLLVMAAALAAAIVMLG